MTLRTVRGLIILFYLALIGGFVLFLVLLDECFEILSIIRSLGFSLAMKSVEFCIALIAFINELIKIPIYKVQDFFRKITIDLLKLMMMVSDSFK